MCQNIKYSRRGENRLKHRNEGTLYVNFSQFSLKFNKVSRTKQILPRFQKFLR